MDTHATFNASCGVMLLLAAVTYAATSLVVAPYGRHVQPGWGPCMPARWGWVTMESPALWATLAVFARGRYRFTSANALILSFYLAHYCNRVVVYPFRARLRGKRMPVLVAALAFAFNCFNGYVQAYLRNRLKVSTLELLMRCHVHLHKHYNRNGRKVAKDLAWDVAAAAEAEGDASEDDGEVVEEEGVLSEPYDHWETDDEGEDVEEVEEDADALGGDDDVVEDMASVLVMSDMPELPHARPMRVRTQEKPVKSNTTVGRRRDAGGNGATSRGATTGNGAETSESEADDDGTPGWEEGGVKKQEHVAKDRQVGRYQELVQL